MTAFKSASADPISLFVAMPYSNLGPHAKWPKPQQVEKFYQLVAKSIEEILSRAVRLEIAKYTRDSGLVIDSMFRAIQTADVFIADLTGSNANVFLELGIRYGVSNKVTILTTQEDAQPPFDLNQMRVVRYGNGPTQEAQDAIAQIVANELDTLKSKSPVLALLDAEVVPREKWEIVSGQRIEVLLEESKRASDPETRLQRVLEAVDLDPLSHTARVALSRVRRARQEFDKALAAARAALQVFPKSAQLHKERGLVLDRMTSNGEDRLDAAIDAYRMALQFDDSDADLHSCYGGALRRKGLLSDSSSRFRYMERALEHYRRSQQLDRHSTYAGLNVLRLLLLLQPSANEAPVDIEEYKKRMYFLCAFEVTESHLNSENEQWWRKFDLADVLVFRNEGDEALHVYREAIASIPDPVRADTLISPIRTWKELLTAGQLQSGVCTNAEQILSLLENSLSKRS